MSYKNVKSSGYGTRKSQVAEEAFPTSPQPKSIFRPKQWNLEVEDGKIFFRTISTLAIYFLWYNELIYMVIIMEIMRNLRGEEAFQWGFNIVNQMIFMWKFFINSMQSDKALFQNMLLKSFESWYFRSWYDNIIWVWTLSRQSKLFNIFMLHCRFSTSCFWCNSNASNVTRTLLEKEGMNSVLFLIEWNHYLHSENRGK